MLGRRGAMVVDADEVARDVTAPGTPGHDAVLEAFGDDVRRPDGTLDRAALARLVFSDPPALRRLESIVHPLVRPAIRERLDRAVDAAAPVVVIEAIKLVEGGLAELCDEVWLVDCRPQDQRSRLAARGMAATEADRRISTQGDIRSRIGGRADRTIGTSRPLEDIDALVDELWVDLTRAGPV